MKERRRPARRSSHTTRTSVAAAISISGPIELWWLAVTKKKTGLRRLRLLLLEVHAHLLRHELLRKVRVRARGARDGDHAVGGPLHELALLADADLGLAHELQLHHLVRCVSETGKKYAPQ